MKSLVLPFTVFLLTPGFAQDTQGKEVYWTNWRGPDGTCIAPTGNPPTKWSEKENIRWKVAVPGLGISSPIVLKNRIYLTTAIATDEESEAPQAGGDNRGGNRRRGFGGGRGRPTKVHEFAVLALDRKDGSVVWNKVVKKAVPHERGHQTGSQASNSPLTDGEHIFASFGSRGLHCLDMDGNLKWSKDLGLMRTAMGFGEGASPALYGDKIVVNWDHEGDSFLVALDKRTGKQLWRKERDESTSWSTPFITSVNGKPQVIVCASGASRGYDLKTGAEIWFSVGMTRNCIPTPLYSDGVLYLMSGFSGASLQAIDLEKAKGRVKTNKGILWRHRRGTPYTPSGLVYGGFVYFLRSNSAVLSCLDAKTGEVKYEGEKLRRMRDVYSSLVGAAGRIYVTSRDGTTKVFKVGPKYEELASNELDDGFDATAAIVGDQIYLRGRKSLYCIAAK